MQPKALRSGPSRSALIALAALGLAAAPAAPPVFAQGRPSPEAQGTGARQPAPQPAPRPGAGSPAPAQAPAPLPPVAAPVTDASRALARLDALEAEQRSLTGRIETLEAEIVRLKEENRLLAGLATRPAATVSAEVAAAVPADTASAPATPAPSPPAALGAAPGAPAATSAAPAAEAARAPATAQARPADTPPPPTSLTPIELISQARLDLQNGAYPGAETKLRQLIATYPQAPEAAEARWLLGETRRVQSAWAPAAEAYVAYLQAHPDGARAPDALVRVAGVFRELGDNRQRCVALQRFAAIAPNPPAALRARADVEIARAPCPPPGG